MEEPPKTKESDDSFTSMKFEDDELADDEFNPDQKIILHQSLSEFYSNQNHDKEED